MRTLALIALAATIASPAIAKDFSVVHMSAVDDVRYLHVSSGGSMDVLKLTCSAGAVSSAAIYSPRDVATGQSSGKRMHKPFVIVKEWGPAPPMLSSSKASYDLKKNTAARVAGGKTMATDDWHQVSVSGVSAACDSPAAVGKASYSDLSVTK